MKAGGGEGTRKEIGKQRRGKGDNLWELQWEFEVTPVLWKQIFRRGKQKFVCFTIAFYARWTADEGR